MSNTNEGIIFTATRQPKNARKDSERRSLRHSNSTPDEIGQHCRAAYMQDLLAQAPRLAAIAELLLASEDDGAAIEALTTFLGNAREIGKTAKVFRETHGAKQKNIIPFPKSGVA
jgi:hypothetical protein